MGLQTGSTNITSGKTNVLTTPSGEVPADAETASNKPVPVAIYRESIRGLLEDLVRRLLQSGRWGASGYGVPRPV